MGQLGAIASRLEERLAVAVVVEVLGATEQLSPAPLLRCGAVPRCCRVASSDKHTLGPSLPIEL